MHAISKEEGVLASKYQGNTSIYSPSFIRGIHKSSYLNVRDIWNTCGIGNEIFNKVCHIIALLFLMRGISFDDITDWFSRRELDKLVSISAIFENIVTNFQAVCILEEFVTINEMLKPFIGKCSLRQYMPSNPAKYGIKYLL